MPDPLEIRRSIRRRLARPGLTADVAADVNVVVATGGTASSRQHVSVRQRPTEADPAEGPGEQPERSS